MLLGSWLLAGCLVIFCRKCSMVLDSPIGSYPSARASLKGPLLARQVGTYSDSDVLNSIQGATFNCYRGGIWVPHTSITSTMKYACSNVPYNYVGPASDVQSRWPPVHGLSAHAKLLCKVELTRWCDAAMLLCLKGYFVVALSIRLSSNLLGQYSLANEQLYGQRPHQ